MFIIIITIYFKNVEFLQRYARVGSMPQGKQPTFSDTLQELTQPLMNQSPSDNCPFMGMGMVKSFGDWMAVDASISRGLWKRCWDLEPSSAVEFPLSSSLYRIIFHMLNMKQIRYAVNIGG